MRKVLVIAGCFAAMSLFAQAKPAELKFSGAAPWAPIFYAKDGKMVEPSYGNDVGLELAKRAGTKGNWLKDIPWARLWTMMDDGSIDIIVGAGLTEERKAKYVFLEPFISSDYRIFVKAGKEFRFESLDDLKGKSTGRQNGAKYSEEYEAFVVANKIDIAAVTGGKDNTFPMLLNGRLDYVVMDYFDGMDWIKSRDYVGKLVALPKPLYKSDVYIVLSPKSPWAKYADELKKALLDMRKDGTLDRLLDRYK